MIKHIMLALILLIVLSGSGSAALGTVSLNYQDDGIGVFYHSFEPYGYSMPHMYVQNYNYINNHTKTLYVKWDAIIKVVGSPSPSYYYTHAYEDSTNYYHGCDLGEYSRNVGYHTPKSTSLYRTVESGNTHRLQMTMAAYAGTYTTSYIDYTMTVSETPFYQYEINGTYDCIDWVKFYIKDNDDTYRWVNQSITTPYTFQIYNNTNYKLVFSDDHEYIFTCNNESITYNYDGCSHTLYRFEETCGNLIPDSEGLYIENYGLFGDDIKDFYVSDGILDISEISADFMYVYTNTFIGKTAWIIDPVITDTTYTLQNPNIAWNLKVIVQNESDGEIINGAMVKVDQDCYCTDGYSIRQKQTINGTVEFNDMSLLDASLFVMASGYKICDENTTGYDVFLSGRTNFSSKTWVVKLAPSGSENVSTFYEVGNKVDIHFRDINGNRTTQIRDTDAEVYLYYENNNTENEGMTLKFQSSSTHTYFIDELSWTISHDDIGYKTIDNAYFTPWDYSYRAVIYNSSIYGWNITLPLTVRNTTKEETLHYQNLTTSLFFIGASDGKIDYREDMNIAVHACSNNTTLMYMDIELYKNNSLLCYKNMTSTDFTGASFPYWYVWSPVFEYEAGANYSIRMYGFDRTLLETNYIECIADTITRKNKLTIVVKNRFGTTLDNAYVYLDGYGSLSTGSNSYAAYEGLDNGFYRFKATKPDYESSGWDDVTLSDGDRIVTYILIESSSAAGALRQPVKADDDDLRGLFIALISLLIICIIFGGFIYVIQ